MEHMTRTFEDAQYLIKKTREETEKEETRKDKPKINDDDNGIKEEEEDLTPHLNNGLSFLICMDLEFMIVIHVQRYIQHIY